MIQEKDLFPLHFYDYGTPFCGSDEGMRFRLWKEKQEEEMLCCVVWPEPNAYEETPEEKKQRKDFPYSPEGYEEAKEWLRKEKEEHFSGEEKN